MAVKKNGLPCVAILIAAVVVVVASMAGCGSCPVGREIVIPAADQTDPAVALEFHLPGGQIISASAASSPPVVVVPGGGTVTLIASATDDQGAKDIQLWIGTKTCTTDPAAGTTTCSGPGLQGAPTASNPDARAAGQNGCTARVVSHNLVVTRTPTRSVSYEVEARGLNFGGRQARTQLIRLEAQ
jgi:hypothetical protein